MLFDFLKLKYDLSPIQSYASDFPDYPKLKLRQEKLEYVMFQRKLIVLLFLTIHRLPVTLKPILLKYHILEYLCENSHMKTSPISRLIVLLSKTNFSTQVDARKIN